MSDEKRQPILVSSVNTSRKYSLVIYGDTTGFSTFVQRTADDPNLHRAYLLNLYRIAFAYQAETGCFLKLLCDGFLAVHEFVDDNPPPVVLASIFNSLARVYDETKKTHSGLHHPRPGDFRITAAMGYVWALTLKTETPANCGADTCGLRSIHDYFGYPTILAKRMLEGSNRVPIMVCQAIKEILEEVEDAFDFRQLPVERRIPSGVFKEDMSAMWELRQKKKP